MDSRFGNIDCKVVKMKCDELKSYKPSDLLFSGFSVCKKEDVDEAIAELKSEINRKNGVCNRWFERCMKSRAENRRLKRALWLLKTGVVAAKG